MNKEKTIYDLVLHEPMEIERGDDGILFVIRVPGGWLYVQGIKGSQQLQQTFVPFHNEFQSPKTFLESLEDD